MNTNPQVGSDASDPKSSLARRRMASRMVRPSGWTAGLVTAGTIGIALALIGCSSTPTVSTSSAPSPSATSPAPSRSAWTRGTHVVVTNSSGSEVKISEFSASERTPPNVLPENASIAYLDEWTAGLSTGEQLLIFYPDLPANRPARLKMYNNADSTGVQTYGYKPSGNVYLGEKNVMSEGESWVTKVEGKQITITRLADDGDNKNWTMTLDP